MGLIGAIYQGPTSVDPTSGSRSWHLHSSVNLNLKETWLIRPCKCIVFVRKPLH